MVAPEINADSASMPSLADSRPRAQAGMEEQTAMQVLLVEDSSGDARLVQEQLRTDPAHGFNVASVTNLADALAALEAGEGADASNASFDVILCDLTLPDASGLEAVMRLHTAAPTTPIVIITGRDDPGYFRPALAAGAQDFLLKAELASTSLARSIHYAIERSRIQRHLLLSEARLRQIMASSPDGIVSLAPNGEIRFVGRLLGVLGHSDADAPELVGKSIFDILPPAQHVVVRAALDRIIRTGRRTTIELHVQTKEGADLWLESHMSPVLGSGGAVSEIVCVTSDVTQRKIEATNLRDDHESLTRTHERLQETYDALAESERVRNQILKNITHDIAQPLTPVNLQIAAMQMRATADERDRRGFAILERNLQQLERMIRDLGDVGGIQSGSLSVACQPAPLGPLVHGAVDGFREAAERAGLSLTVDVRGAMPTVIDQQRITQVISNLITNTIKFTEAGGAIVVTAGEKDDMAEVRVMDTGRGLTDSDLRKLFRPFARIQRTDAPTKPGTGLGIYISQSLIEAHGGQLWAESDGHGHGATFGFRVPLAKGKSGEQEQWLTRLSRPVRSAFGKR